MMYETLKEFIRPELVVLIPVLYLVGIGLKKSQTADKLIPVILGGVGVLLSGMYIFATMGSVTLQGAILALFSALTQGVLTAGASVYANQLVKQAGRP